jgi:hypothetical protein
MRMRGLEPPRGSQRCGGRSGEVASLRGSKRDPGNGSASLYGLVFGRLGTDWALSRGVTRWRAVDLRSSIGPGSGRLRELTRMEGMRSPIVVSVAVAVVGRVVRGRSRRVAGVGTARRDDQDLRKAFGPRSRVTKGLSADGSAVTA